MKYLFCTHRDWSKELYKKLAKRYQNMILLSDPKKITQKYLNQIKPKYIFFPDWSWIIPSEIIDSFNCVCIHESNLPKFRGGSPIQNQIIRGITKTKSTAFLMTNGLDDGDIFDKIMEIPDKNVMCDKFDMIDTLPYKSLTEKDS